MLAYNTYEQNTFFNFKTCSVTTVVKIVFMMFVVNNQIGIKLHMNFYIISDMCTLG